MKFIRVMRARFARSAGQPDAARQGWRRRSRPVNRRSRQIGPRGALCQL